jgi:hypothetical protein
MWSLVAAPAIAALMQTSVLPGPANRACEEPYRVSREEIREAMRTHGPYSLTSTNTATLFSSHTILSIVRRRHRDAPGQTQFLISQSDWFATHLETAGVPYSDMSASARAAFEHHQDILVDYGPQVVRQSSSGSMPITALDVTLFWPDSGGAPSDFHYKDTVSIPKLAVFNQRVVRLKMLEYHDMLVFDRISGMAVRPLGFLSAIFAVLGKPDLKETRLAVSRDYWQVVRGRVKVFPGISKTGTATIEPDGRGHEGVPKTRPDLQAIAQRIRRPLELRYGPPSCQAELRMRRADEDCMGVMGGAGACAGE